MSDKIDWLTLGYDIAYVNSMNGLCAISWESGQKGKIIKLELITGASDEMAQWTWATIRNFPASIPVACGIDQPFGFPEYFLTFIKNWFVGSHFTIEAPEFPDARKRRLTEVKIHEDVGIWPQSPVDSMMTGTIAYQCKPLRKKKCTKTKAAICLTP